MADTLTPTIGLTKIEVGASDDTWGDKLNANMDLIDAAILALQSAVSGASIPVGTIMLVASSAIPSNTVKANGQALARVGTYAALYAKIGTTYGAGDGSTTFNVPDLRGEFIRVWDDGRGVDSGRTLGSAQSDLVKAHTHTASAASDGAHTHTASSNSTGSHTHTGDANSGGAHAHTASSNSTGSHAHTIPAGSSGTPADDTKVGTAQDGLGTLVNVPTSSTGAHSHTITVNSGGAHTHVLSIDAGGAHSHTITVNSGGAHTHVITVNANVGAENRPRNIALMAVIKY